MRWQRAGGLGSLLAPRGAEALSGRAALPQNGSAAAHARASQTNAASFVTEKRARMGKAGSLAPMFSQADSYADLRRGTASKCLESGLHLPWDPVTFRTTPVNAESVTINKERESVCLFVAGLLLFF